MSTFKLFLEDFRANILTIQQVAQKKGYDIEVYHGTNSKNFTQFETRGLSAHFGSMEAAQDRNTHLKDFSQNVVGRDHEEGKLLHLYLKIENPLDMPDLAGIYQTERGELIGYDEVDDRIDDFYHEDRDNPETPYPMSWESDEDFSTWLLANDIIDTDEFWDVQYSKDDAVKLLKQKGYDGIAYINEIEAKGSTSYIIFDPSQVKSADEATYDDQGNHIPFEDRFDESNDDIRY